VHIGLVGLGKMGGNMRERLRRAGIEVTGYDFNPEISDVGSLEDLVKALPAPRLVWVMVPAGAPTDATIHQLDGLLEPDDLVIDGGNSKFTDDARHAEQLGAKDIHFLDCGVSGGVWGLENGYGLMVGGEAELVERAMPVFDALRPEGPREEGFVHAGAAGAGHYAKMVHNGIEYGLMQAYAEGFEVMNASEFELDLEQIAGIWRYGSVVRSWLLDLLHDAFDQHGGDLRDIAGYVEDSGEGRWTIFEAINENVPAPAITAALYARFASRQEESFAAKINAALRQQFGGHAVKPEQ